MSSSSPDGEDLVPIGTDPAAFEAFYRRHVEHRGAAAPGLSATAVARRALQAMAQFPGAAVVPGTARDAAGRRGVALRWPGAHVDLIFDPATHAYRGTRFVSVRDGKESLHMSTAVIRMATVERPGQVP